MNNNKNFKHLRENQFNWLQLYINKPIEGKIRKLYLNFDDVYNFLKNKGFKSEYNNQFDVFILRHENINVYLTKDYMVVNGMDIILTRPYNNQ